MDTDPQTDPRPGSRLSTVALVLALLPFISWGACTAGLVDPESDAGTSTWLLACVLALVGVVMGLVALIRGRGAGMALAAMLVGLLSPVITFFLGLGNVSYTRGRALRRAGRARLPPSVDTSGWDHPFPARIDAPPEVADGWRANGATETASIAAFAHLANELLALGAPADLLEKAHADAVDEIRHARLCYGIANAVDGKTLGAGAFPDAVLPRDGALTLASLAAECVVESCLLESTSARVARALADRSGVPDAIHAALETIAVDEARHAEHGWEIVRWSYSAGGMAVARAMRAALARHDDASGSSPVQTDALEAFGLAGPALWRRCLAEARRDAEAELDALLGGAVAKAA